MHSRHCSWLLRLWQRPATLYLGQELIEMALITALCGMALIGTLSILATATRATFANVEATVNEEGASTPPPASTAIPTAVPTTPPLSTPVPTTTVVPPTNTAVPPTSTPVPPTATSVPPTATRVPPTSTPIPPTATRVPPTATRVPPTATRVPPTATPCKNKSKCP